MQLPEPDETVHGLVGKSWQFIAAEFPFPSSQEPPVVLTLQDPELLPVSSVYVVEPQVTWKGRR